MAEPVGEYITAARQLTRNGCYSKAFDYYVMAFEENPDTKHLHEAEFREVLTRLNELLSSASKMEDIYINHSRALTVFPDNYYLTNDMAKFLFKCGFYEKAWEYFEHAIKLNPNFVNAEKSFNSLKNFLVERWHFRMLNDRIRNQTYKLAIHDVLVPYVDTVLDLGTGTGLLSLYANENFPKSIIGCDGTKVMCELATAITQENNCDKCIILNKLSTEMHADEIGGKCSLLLTEMFDAGLFGEHVVQSLLHAWENLISDDGRVIPNKAEFFVMGAKCDFLNKRYQLGSSVKTLLNIPTLNVHILTLGETYDCEDVHLYGDDIEYMTEPQSLIKVNFNNYQELKNLIESDHYEVESTALKSGEIDTVIGFFNLYLTDQLTITTDPRSERRANAWQQAIFYDKIPIKVEKNDSVPMYFSLNGGKLTMYRDDFITRISQYTLRFLNDTEYIDVISGCIGMACVYLGQIANMSQIVIFDLCPFPLFGLQLLKRGAKSLTCKAKTDSDKQFFETVFQSNNIDLSRVTILLGDDFSHEDSIEDEKYHVVFCHIFDMCGEIDLRLKDIGQHLRQHHLLEGGLFLPDNVYIMGSVIRSDWLDINNRLFDTNVGYYNISNHLNPYRVSQNFSIDFSHLEYIEITQPTMLGNIGDPLESEAIEVRAMQEGPTSAIMFWYSIELMEHVKEISTKRKNCFMDGALFMTDPEIYLNKYRRAQIQRSVDPEGDFKFSLTVDSI